MTDTTCQICQQRPPREGLKVCGVCLGMEDEPTMDPIQTVESPTERTPFHCHTCGKPIEPYKLGRNIILSGICRPCVMRKKYGPDWVPGGDRKEVQARARAKRAAKKAENGTKQDKPAETRNLSSANHNTEGSFHGDFVVRLVFDTRDQAMYRRIQEIATKERRTTEQQILYFLDQSEIAHAS